MTILLKSNGDGSGTIELNGNNAITITSAGIISFPATSTLLVTNLSTTGTTTLGNSTTSLNSVVGILQVDRVQEDSIALDTNIDLSLSGFFIKTITANTTFTISNPPASGKVQYFSLQLTNAGAFSIVWPAGFKWVMGLPPTLTANGVDIITAYTSNGGTSYFANALLDVK